MRLKLSIRTQFDRGGPFSLSPIQTQVLGNASISGIRAEDAAMRRTLVLFVKASNFCSAETSGLISFEAQFQIRNSERRLH